MMQQAVAETQSVVEAAKADDLTHRIPLDGKTGDIRTLCAGVNDLLDGMSGIIADIKVASDTIAAASGEISTGSRSEEHTSELQSLMRISYAVFCLKKTTKPTQIPKNQT